MTDQLPEGWTFEDPPPSAKRGGPAGRDFTALVANPGRWVRLNVHYTSGATSARRAAEKKHGGQWESCTRSNPSDETGKKCLVFLRYLGPDATTTPLRPGKSDRRQVVDLPDPRPIQPATTEPFGVCSCGKEIADADAWGQHNQTVANPKAHKLNRRAS